MGKRKSKAALQEAVERGSDPPVSKSPGRESSQDRLYLDCEFSDLTKPSLITFLAQINYRGRQSSLRFSLDSGKLAQAEAQKLADFLAARQASTTRALQLTEAITWLLDILLRKTRPHLARANAPPKCVACYGDRPDHDT
jgi:hypothetical protein